MASCQPGDGTVVADTDLSDEQLAQRYCGSCHLFPEPSALDRTTWLTSVLPAMSWRLGIRDTAHRPVLGRNMSEQFLIKQANVFPDSALLSEESWRRIVSYYDSLSSDQLPPATPSEATPSEATPSGTVPRAGFTPQPVSLGLSTGGLTTLLRQHPTTGDIYLGDGTRMLYQLDSAGQTKDFFELPSPVTDVHFQEDGTAYLLAVGNLNPHDEPLGKLLTMDARGNSQTLVEALHRPVHLNVGDLDGDEREDLVICEFGNYIGRLSWFQQTKAGGFKQRVLWEQPGAIKTILHDLNQDGQTDVIALMAQGREGVYAFYHQGDGQFDRKPLLQFSSVFGTSDFTITDIDQDGDDDILVVNGDNADLSPVLKPYHGVRVYRNDGSNQFEESYFYPMYGATRLLAEDFDNDGDTDLVVTAYFADFDTDHPTSFTYLENRSDEKLAFEPSALPVNQGRWLVAEPWQRNGRPGVMLGAFNLGFRRGQQQVADWQAENVNLLLLEKE